MTKVTVPAYTIPPGDEDLLQAGCVLTRLRLYEAWILADWARRCVLCQRVFWRSRRGKHVDRGGRIVPEEVPEVPLRTNEKYCGTVACRRAAARQARNMAASKTRPTLGWMCTLADVAAATGFEREELRGIIERNAKPDLYGERVSRLPGWMLTEYLGARLGERPGLDRLLRQGIVARQLAPFKSEGLPPRFRGLVGGLTDWVLFVRSYEGRPAEDGDTAPEASSVA